MPTAALAGIIAGVVVIPLLLGLFLFLFVRRRWHRRQSSKMPLQSPPTPSLPFHGFQTSPLEPMDPFADPPEKSSLDQMPTDVMRMQPPDRTLDKRSPPQLPPVGALRDSMKWTQDDLGNGNLLSRNVSVLQSTGASFTYLGLTVS